MATKSITKNIEITDSVKAKRLVEALEVAERIGEDMPEILNKKQLEDAAECGIDKPCSKCNCRDIRKRNPVCKCVSEVAKTALAYREMLEEVIKHLSHCPFCKINRPWLYKHKDGCKLAALLKEGDEQDG